MRQQWLPPDGDHNKIDVWAKRQEKEAEVKDVNR